MTFKILIVDDSNLFCRHMEGILNADPDITVVGTARNGQEAVDKVLALDPDVVTMDVEMPIMDGISAVKTIMARHPLPILMFSALTYSGAQATLEALDAGALDFLPKRFEDITSNREEAIKTLRQRVKELAAQKSAMAQRRRPSPNVITQVPDRLQASSISPVKQLSHHVSAFSSSEHKKYKIVLIGASTGGPVALQQILSALPRDFPLPILLVQHMPGTFTHAFAERLDACCEISVKEAENLDSLKAGHAYLAPGGKQMFVEHVNGACRIRVVEDENATIIYKPSVNVTFESLVSIASHQVIAIVLTGMGNDGQEGCRKLGEVGATIWAQDEESCVVYGMPQAIVKANIANLVLPLQSIASSLLKAVGYR